MLNATMCGMELCYIESCPCILHKCLVWKCCLGRHVLLPAFHNLLGRVVALLPAVARLPALQVVVHRLQLARRVALHREVKVLRTGSAEWAQLSRGHGTPATSCRTHVSAPGSLLAICPHGGPHPADAKPCMRLDTAKPTWPVYSSTCEHWGAAADILAALSLMATAMLHLGCAVRTSRTMQCF